MFPKKGVERFLEALNASAKELRPKIGYLKVKEVRIGKSEVRAFCLLDNVDGLTKLLVKYDGEKVWVEGPKWAAIPLKNKLKSYLAKRA